MHLVCQWSRELYLWLVFSSRKANVSHRLHVRETMTRAAKGWLRNNHFGAVCETSNSVMITAQPQL